MHIIIARLTLESLSKGIFKGHVGATRRVTLTKSITN